ncbi:MAG: hypothetical protein A3C43_06465 [Candidatus Schekmanbacteria bacterium RIFCSPHIGHO2_02_FULL_38_11]|uniref:DNA gyrase inhibitor YacG n=1 Tax=Candidatus Schekmanbacteria bacterium RIFCSPLOWO2_12_FULL_38_15 TaxID=1817883 RepID=A0A1F7SM95_9BACT|nr:MAG: hypothetical protein A2043_02190 [Candidatus Schekmanbacteria bacterium GWA2_38_9]OGL49524.1 MAG: hypothetical protein A3C43_06465 [Candidatus Schekmanbacteria bacterium RIFCSPHIGHO2_02_FULL_38_11]OGL50973.1 MAG: hypothetical protein A3H37_10865 [Candidatus Schekmanbacteria bacterium RIFCSPLOWO2_02_FULL_38_14]OGL54900.1 MAG: hypothetical protein A3G31_02145 [Candidatus Schekmanbacteria bacterium RIFCSPLOWO2_12_FULL_38_15]
MKCPTCDKQVKFKNNLFRPFCSERCKLVDLGHWFEERYIIKGQEDESGEKNSKELPEENQSSKEKK